MIATALEPILLDVDISVEEYDLELEVEEYDLELETAIIIKKIEGEEYEGPYGIIPTLEDQMFDTRNKVFRDYLTVYEIPYSEVSNPVGGKTAIIGGI